MDTNREVFEFSLRADKQNTAPHQSRGGMGAEAQNELLDHTGVLQWLRNETSISDAEESHNLGLKYAQGLGVELDKQRAVTYYRRAAEQGHAEAQYDLGGMYEQGQGVAQDDAVALQWMCRAAEQGSAPAQTKIPW